MNIGSSTGAQALQAQAQAQQTNANQSASMAMLKKVLENQQDVAERLMSQDSPKGQLIDIRV